MKAFIILLAAVILSSCAMKAHCPTYFGSKGSAKHKKSQTHYAKNAKSLGKTVNR